MNFKIPKPIKQAMEIMKENGFESYIVGGSVRDFLMGKQPADFDITTNAKPEETKRCFLGYKVIETGIKHGTVTVLINHEPIEITTFRIDGKYTDNRHPESVEFTGNLKDDLSRRDFTVNALAYDGENEICDLFSGCEDLEKKVIRCVGEPDQRFTEDGLRILRALRFASVLDFTIDEKTERSIRKNKLLLKNISKERILSELTKLVCGVNAKKILLSFREVFEVFIPELENSKNYEKNIEAMCKTEPKKELRFAALFCECDGGAVLKELRSDKRTTNAVSELVSGLGKPIEADRVFIKKVLSKTDVNMLLSIVDLKLAFGEDKEKCQKIKELIEKIEESSECVRLAQLDITGSDLKNEAGIHGKQVGQALEFLLNCVIEGKTENKREELLKAVKGFCSQY